MGHHIFNGTADAVTGTGRAVVNGAGYAVEGGAAAGTMIGAAGGSMLDGVGDFNEWAQENYARFDHLEQKGDETRPFSTLADEDEDQDR
jgi:hypothetical protein